MACNKREQYIFTSVCSPARGRRSPDAHLSPPQTCRALRPAARGSHRRAEGAAPGQGSWELDPRHCSRCSLLRLRFKLMSHAQASSQEAGNRGGGGPIPTQQPDGAGVRVCLSRICQDSSHLSAHEGGRRHLREAERQTSSTQNAHPGLCTARTRADPLLRWHRSLLSLTDIEKYLRIISTRRQKVCYPSGTRQSAGLRKEEPTAVFSLSGAGSRRAGEDVVLSVNHPCLWERSLKGHRVEAEQPNSTTVSWQKVHWKVHIPWATRFFSVSDTDTVL